MLYEIKGLIEKVIGYRYLVILDTCEYLVKKYTMPAFNQSVENINHIFVWSILCDRSYISELFLEKTNLKCINIIIVYFSFNFL